MEYIIYFIIALFSSTIGSICGIGGGIIIKPVMDAAGTLGSDTIHFLSGCTVLAMTIVSVGTAAVKKELNVDPKVTTPIAISAAVGGVAGKLLFQWSKQAVTDPVYLESGQSIFLMLLTVGTLIYSLNRSRISPKELHGLAGGLMVGFSLGLVSSFLGIGGGPFNLIVLYFFFAMSTKQAVQNSLYIILFSQLASTLITIIGGTVPEFSPLLLILMAAGGVTGGNIGRMVNKKIDEAKVDKLFRGLLIVIILISVYNSVRVL